MTILYMHGLTILYVHVIEAIKRYHESRRRKVNDKKPERLEQVARNKQSTKRYQRKRQVRVSSLYRSVSKKTSYSAAHKQRKTGQTRGDEALGSNSFRCNELRV